MPCAWATSAKSARHYSQCRCMHNASPRACPPTSMKRVPCARAPNTKLAKHSPQHHCVCNAPPRARLPTLMKCVHSAPARRPPVARSRHHSYISLHGCVGLGLGTHSFALQWIMPAYPMFSIYLARGRYTWARHSQVFSIFLGLPKRGSAASRAGGAATPSYSHLSIPPWIAGPLSDMVVPLHEAWPRRPSHPPSPL